MTDVDMRWLAALDAPRLKGEASCADDHALVGTADHCAAKVADGIRTDGAVTRTRPGTRSFDAASRADVDPRRE